MKFKKPNFIAGTVLKTQNYLKKIKEKYQLFSQSEADIIVVLGGDGFMLDVLKISEFKFTILWNKSGYCWFFDESETR